MLGKRRKRLLQFRLRTLLLGTVFVGLLLGHAATARRGYLREQHALAGIGVQSISSPLKMQLSTRWLQKAKAKLAGWFGPDDPSNPPNPNQAWQTWGAAIPTYDL